MDARAHAVPMENCARKNKNAAKIAALNVEVLIFLSDFWQGGGYIYVVQAVSFYPFQPVAAPNFSCEFYY